MKYSAALRQASTIFKPASGVWFASATEACAVAAIAFVATGATIKEIEPSFGKKNYDFNGSMEAFMNSMQETVVENLPLSKEEFESGWHKTMKAMGPDIAVLSAVSVGTVIMVLNDGCGWTWEKIAEWLETIGASHESN